MQKTVKIIVKSADEENEYTISTPNAGQLVDIENLKITLTPHYSQLARKQMILSDLALDIVDMQAYFTVLCPKLLKDMKVPLIELDIADLLQLRETYEKQFLPWWNGWIKLIGKIPEAPEQEDKDEETVVEKIKPNVEGEEPHIDLT